MKSNRYITLLFTFVFSIALSNKIAVATKVKGPVEIMPIGKKGFSEMLKQTD